MGVGKKFIEVQEGSSWRSHTTMPQAHDQAHTQNCYLARYLASLPLPVFSTGYGNLKIESN